MRFSIKNYPNSKSRSLLPVTYWPRSSIADPRLGGPPEVFRFGLFGHHSSPSRNVQSARIKKFWPSTESARCSLDSSTKNEHSDIVYELWFAFWPDSRYWSSNLKLLSLLSLAGQSDKHYLIDSRRTAVCQMLTCRLPPCRLFVQIFRSPHNLLTAFGLRKVACV